MGSAAATRCAKGVAVGCGKELLKKIKGVMEHKTARRTKATKTTKSVKASKTTKRGTGIRPWPPLQTLVTIAVVHAPCLFV